MKRVNGGFVSRGGEDFIIERIVKGVTRYIKSRDWEEIETDEELSSAPTGLTEQLEKLFADYPADFYGEAQDFKMEVRAILEYSSAPTGLTRERLDELIDGIWKVETGTPIAHERYGAQLLRDAILESSSAPTPTGGEWADDEIRRLSDDLKENPNG